MGLLVLASTGLWVLLPSTARYSTVTFPRWLVFILCHWEHALSVNFFSKYAPETMISGNPENITGLLIPCAMQNDGGIQLGKLWKLQRMFQIKWRSSLGSIIRSSQLCMLFIATYLAMQIKYILLARVRFGAGKNRVSACPCAAAHWRLRLHLCGGFLNFFREKKPFYVQVGFLYFKAPISLWLCSLTTEAFNSHLIASVAALRPPLVLSSAPLTSWAGQPLSRRGF